MTATTSSWRVTNQIIVVPSMPGWQKTGSVARIRANVRRSRGQVGPQPETITVGSLVLDPERRELTLEGDARQALGELRTVELIYEKARSPELEYMFKHALTHEVTYGSLLADRRRALVGMLGFVAGFGVVFISLSIVFGTLGFLLTPWLDLILRVGGSDDRPQMVVGVGGALVMLNHVIGPRRSRGSCSRTRSSCACRRRARCSARRSLACCSVSIPPAKPRGSIRSKRCGTSRSRP